MRPGFYLREYILLSLLYKKYVFCKFHTVNLLKVMIEGLLAYNICSLTCSLFIASNSIATLLYLTQNSGQKLKSLNLF